MPMEDTYGIQSRIGSIIVVERWYCCRGSPVFSDRNIQVTVLVLHLERMGTILQAWNLIQTDSSQFQCASQENMRS